MLGGTVLWKLHYHSNVNMILNSIKWVLWGMSIEWCPGWCLNCPTTSTFSELPQSIPQFLWNRKNLKKPFYFQISLCPFVISLWPSKITTGTKKHKLKLELGNFVLALSYKVTTQLSLTMLNFLKLWLKWKP